jgi:proliferating cell nuclear antigen
VFVVSCNTVRNLQIRSQNVKDGKFSQFCLNLTNIDSEEMTIPEFGYQVSATMMTNEFQKMVKDLSLLGDTVNIIVGKPTISFKVTGEIGNGTIN